MKWFSLIRKALFFALTSLHPPTLVEVSDLSLLGDHHQLASETHKDFSTPYEFLLASQLRFHFSCHLRLHEHPRLQFCRAFCHPSQVTH